MAVKPEKEARETEVGFTASCEELVNSTPRKSVWITLLRTPAFYIFSECFCVSRSREALFCSWTFICRSLPVKAEALRVP